MSNEDTTASKLDKLPIHGANSDPRSQSFFGIAIVAKFILLGLVVGLLIHYYLRGDLTQENLKQITAALPTSLFLPAYFLLPLGGFPISILLLASGMKYGFGLSIAIAVVGMGFHTFTAWHLAHGLFRHRLEKWLNDTRFELPKIPRHHQIWFTSVFVTVPGLPYAVKLYSLALTNLPFGRYLLIVWFVHVLNAIPFIGIGTAAITLNPSWLVAFGVLALLTVLGTNWLRKKFLTEN